MEQKIEQFKNYLINEEKADATVEKYVRDVTAFGIWLDGRDWSKEAVMAYKSYLADTHEAASVNSMLSSLNSYCVWSNRSECRVKNIKIQRSAYLDSSRLLTREEYALMLEKALELKQYWLYYVMQTICSCGIRVSELVHITIEAVKQGCTEIDCKGKKRTIFLPDKLIDMLRNYAAIKNIKHGSIFVTRTGNPLNRSNVWKAMKKLAEKAGVAVSKVFPHALRHLFARTYYQLHQDIVRLSDILGHSSINTTRIYTMESGDEHRRRIQELNLVIEHADNLPVFTT